MINVYTRIAGLVLAFGFFFGCSVTKNTSDNDSPSEGSYEQRIAAVDKQLETEPHNPALYYEKGTLLVEWAQDKKEASQRTTLYEEADHFLQKADSLSDTGRGTDIETHEDDQLRGLAWSNEHNQGIQTTQSASSEKDYRQAAIHFNNAAAIMPDSSVSYKKGSQAFYKGDEPQKAIDLLERARTKVTPTPVELLEPLAFLYMETDQPSKAITIYKEARSRLSHNFNLMHGLSNAYIEAEDHKNAIDILQQLTDKNPENTTYRFSLASEFYKAGREKIIAITDELEENSAFNSTAFSIADSLFSQAETHYSYLIDKEPENTRFVYQTVQFYQNRAAQYQRLLPHLSQEKKKEMTNNIEKNISASVPLLEQLTEQTPNKQLWEYLYRTYSYLGMQKEAEKVKSNF